MPRLVTGLVIALGCHILLLMVPIHSRQETQLQLPTPGGIAVGFGRITPTPPEKPEKPEKKIRDVPPPPIPILPLQERIEVPKPKPKPRPKPKRKLLPPKETKKKRPPTVSHTPVPVKTETQKVPSPVPLPSRPSPLPSKTPSVIGKETHQSPVTSDLKAQVVAKNKPSPPVTQAYPANDGNPPPKYPTLARRRGWEGTVLLSVWVSESGSVNNILILQSSGYPLLDKTALKAVARYRFVPGRKGDHPMAMRVQVPVDFRLKDIK